MPGDDAGRPVVGCCVLGEETGDRQPVRLGVKGTFLVPETVRGLGKLTAGF
jgi:hypothetical protein